MTTLATWLCRLAAVFALMGGLRADAQITRSEIDASGIHRWVYAGQDGNPREFVYQPAARFSASVRSKIETTEDGSYRTSLRFESEAHSIDPIQSCLLDIPAGTDARVPDGWNVVGHPRLNRILLLNLKSGVLPGTEQSGFVLQAARLPAPAILSCRSARPMIAMPADLPDEIQVAVEALVEEDFVRLPVIVPLIEMSGKTARELVVAVSAAYAGPLEQSAHTESARLVAGLQQLQAGGANPVRLRVLLDGLQQAAKSRQTAPWAQELSEGLSVCLTAVGALIGR